MTVDMGMTKDEELERYFELEEEPTEGEETQSMTVYGSNTAETQATMDRIFPDKVYTSDEIYEVAFANNFLVTDTSISAESKILEIVECFHERDDRGDECLETWREDEHETVMEFDSEDGGETFKKFGA